MASCYSRRTDFSDRFSALQNIHAEGHTVLYLISSHTKSILRENKSFVRTWHVIHSWFIEFKLTSIDMLLLFWMYYIFFKCKKKSNYTHVLIWIKVQKKKIDLLYFSLFFFLSSSFYSRSPSLSLCIRFTICILFWLSVKSRSYMVFITQSMFMSITSPYTFIVNYKEKKSNK